MLVIFPRAKAGNSLALEGPAVAKDGAVGVNVARIGPKGAACRGKWRKEDF